MAWIMQNNKPVNTDSVPVPNAPFHGDSPFTFWRINPNINNGRPYVGLMLGVPNAPSPQTSNYYIGNQRVINMYLGDEPVIALK